MTSERMRIFISYSRTDAALCDELVDVLECRGFEPLLDRRSLPYGEEFKAELKELIAEADATIWLLSSRSIVSDWCKFEVDEISRQSKRLIPVVIEAVDALKLPPQIGKLQFLPRSGIFDIENNTVDLVDAIRADRSWLREHSDLSRVASRWEASQRRGLLLTGKSLKDAQAWISRRSATAPPIPAAVELLIQESRRQQRRRGVTWAVGALTLVGIAVLTAVFVEQQRESADRDRSAALENERIAIRRQTEGLAASAQAALARGDTSDALRLSLAAWPRTSDPGRPGLRATVEALRAAMSSPMEGRTLQHEGGEITNILKSKDSKYIVTLSEISGAARIWDLKEWRSIGAFYLGREDTAPIGQQCMCPAAMSPDGSQFAWATHRGDVRVWNVSTGVEASAPFRHGGNVQAISFSRDGKRLAVAVNGAAAQVWDIPSGQATGLPLQLPAQVTRLAFVGASKLLTASSDSSLQLWNTDTWERIWGSRISSLGISDVVVSPDGSKAVIGTATGTSEYVDLNSGSTLAQLRTGQWLQGVQFTVDGKRFATVARDGIVRIWDAGLGSLTGQTDTHPTQVVSFHLSQDGKIITTSTVDGIIRKWDAETGRSIGDPIRNRAKISFAMTPTEGSPTIIVSREGYIFEWIDDFVPLIYQTTTYDPATMSQGERIYRQLRPSEGETAISLVLSDDGRLGAVSSADRVSVFETSTGVHIGGSRAQGGARSMEFSPNGRLLAAGFANGCVGLFRLEPALMRADPIINCRSRGQIETIRFAPNGSRFVTAAADGTVEVWLPSDGGLSGMALAHMGPLRGLNIDNLGRYLATVDGRGVLRVWSLQEGQLVPGTGDIGSSVVAVSFDQVGSRLLFVSTNGAISSLEIATRHLEEVKRADGSGSVTAVFSPSGDVVVLSQPNGMESRATRTGGLLGRFPPTNMREGRPAGSIGTVAISYNSRLLVSKTTDNEFQLWTMSGVPISPPVKKTGMLTMPLLSSDGKILSVADTSVKVFDVSRLVSGDVFELACERLRGAVGLSDTERRYGFTGLLPICGSSEPEALDWTKFQ